MWSIFIICQEWSLTIKHTFFKVVDEGLLDSVLLWVQCRDYIMEINYIMANERNHFYCTICETAHNTENWKYKLPFLCWIPLSSFTNPRAIYLFEHICPAAALSLHRVNWSIIKHADVLLWGRAYFSPFARFIILSHCVFRAWHIYSKICACQGFTAMSSQECVDSLNAL